MRSTRSRFTTVFSVAGYRKSKGPGSRYVAGRIGHGVEVKNPAAPGGAVGDGNGIREKIGGPMSDFHHHNRTVAQDEAKWEADAAKAREADEAREREALIDQILLAKEHLPSLEHGRARLLDQIRESQETIDRSRALIREIDQMLARSVRKP